MNIFLFLDLVLVLLLVEKQTSIQQNGCVVPGDAVWLMTVPSDRRQYLIKSSWLNHHKIDFSSLSQQPRARRPTTRAVHIQRKAFQVMSWASASIFFTVVYARSPVQFFFSLLLLTFFFVPSCDEQPKLRIIKILQKTRLWVCVCVWIVKVTANIQIPFRHIEHAYINITVAPQQRESARADILLSKFHLNPRRSKLINWKELFFFYELLCVFAGALKFSPSVAVGKRIEKLKKKEKKNHCCWARTAASL